MPEAQATAKHSKDYLVRCDCDVEERELRAGGDAWTHDCPSADPKGKRKITVTLAIDADGHMTHEVG